MIWIANISLTSSSLDLMMVPFFCGISILHHNKHIISMARKNYQLQGTEDPSLNLLQAFLLPTLSYQILKFPKSLCCLPQSSLSLNWSKGGSQGDLPRAQQIEDFMVQVLSFIAWPHLLLLLLFMVHHCCLIDAYPHHAICNLNHLWIVISLQQLSDLFSLPYSLKLKLKWFDQLLQVYFVLISMATGGQSGQWIMTKTAINCSLGAMIKQLRFGMLPQGYVEEL